MRDHAWFGVTAMWKERDWLLTSGRYWRVGLADNAFSDFDNADMLVKSGEYPPLKRTAARRHPSDI
jgi:hypothetical protein